MARKKKTKTMMGKWFKVILTFVLSVGMFLMGGSIIPLIAGYSFVEILKAYGLIVLTTSLLGFVALVLGYIFWCMEDDYIG